MTHGVRQSHLQAMRQRAEKAEAQLAAQQSGWISRRDRDPDESDEDDYSLMHVWHEDGYAMLLSGCTSIFDPRFTHWKPTGLKRPGPPELPSAEDT